MAGVTGMEEVLANLDNEVKGIKGRSIAGMHKAALAVQRLSQQRTPVDSGNLKGSAYTRKNAAGVEIGYTAAYAGPVHENMEQKLKGQPRQDFGQTRDGVSFGGGTGKGNYWDSGRPKFLESALVDTDIIGIIAQKAKV